MIKLLNETFFDFNHNFFKIDNVYCFVKVMTLYWIFTFLVNILDFNSTFIHINFCCFLKVLTFALEIKFGALFCHEES